MGGLYLEEKTFNPSNVEQLQKMLINARNSNNHFTLKENYLNINDQLKNNNSNVIPIDLSKLDNILELDRENFTVTVEAGINLLDFQQKLATEGFLLPFDNLTSHLTSLSYNFVNAMPSFYQGKYGLHREYLLGMEVVLYDGTVLSIGGKNIKNVSGYDLMGLFINSYEKLGIITKLTMRLLPKPEVNHLVIAGFDSIEKAISTAAQLVKEGSLPAKLLVFNSPHTILNQLDMPFLVAEFDGFKPSLKSQLNKFEEIVSSSVKDSFQLEATAIDDFWHSMRNSIGPAFINQRHLFSFSSYLTKLPELIVDFNNTITSHPNSTLGMCVNPTVGLGQIISLSPPYSLQQNTVLSLKETLEKHQGQVLAKKDFVNTDMNQIHGRLLKAIGG